MYQQRSGKITLAAHGGIVFPLQRGQIGFTQDLLSPLALKQLPYNDNS